MSILKNYQPTKGTCKVTFTYPADAAKGVKSVHVLGDFNNWDLSKSPKLTLNKGELSTTIELKAGKTYEFRYLLDGLRWDNDHSADNYVSSPFPGIDNSVIILDAVGSSKTEPAKSSAKGAPKASNAKPATTAKVTKPVAKVKEVAAPKVIAKKEVAKKEAAIKAEIKAVITKATSPKAVAPKAAAPKVEAPKKVATPKVIKGGKDDLKKIEGIGPKIAEILTSQGIVTFADLAKAKIDQLKNILDQAGSKFKMHDPSTWPAQSNLAAKGNWDELKKLQDELLGGKVAKK